MILWGYLFWMNQDNLKKINELVKPEDVNLSSFKIKRELNPKFWVKDESGIYKLKKNVKDRLLMIADDFFETLELPWVDVDDIILTGSLSNYNWSEYSDVDLHILIPFEEVDNNIDLVKEYINSKKNVWNNKHNIKIFDHDVEIYGQDTKEPHYSTGIYSLMMDKWIIRPKLTKHKIDSKKIKEKSSSIMSIVEDIENTYSKGEYDKVIRRVTNLLEKIRKMRSVGLESGGEYSIENLTFKVLRREGYIEKLMGLKDKSYDKSLTLN
jgi:hypothetical protein